MFLQTLRLTQKRVSRAASVSDTHLIAGAKKAAIDDRFARFSFENNKFLAPVIDFSK